jgi:hypothetical protein
MAVAFTTQVYLPNFDMFAVPITVIPLASQPGHPPYTARGIYDTDEIDIMAMDGSVISDQKTELDVREAEFPVVPKQNDRVIIPFDCNGKPLGEFEVIDANTNGGGETTLTLRKWETAEP